MSMPSIDPGNLTPDQMRASVPDDEIVPESSDDDDRVDDLRGEPIPLRCMCGSTDIRTGPEEPMAVCGACGCVGLETEFRKDCVVCGEEFNRKRVLMRRAIGKDCCVQCAIDNGEDLHVDDEADYNERRYGGRIV